MNFHLSDDFEEAILKTAESLNLLSIFIEKDYWVTYVLKNLSQSELKSKIIFKGGTSLSKAYNCIERFSEDIDLALLDADKLSDNQSNKIIKQAEKEITLGLEYLSNHPFELKRGRNRKTFYNYNKVLKGSEFGKVKDTIQLELNTFTNPVPHEEAKIQSYVGNFLENSGFGEWVKKYEMQSFNLLVLSRERTFFEKLLSLIRLSYEGEEKLKEKIRHFYDLHKLFSQPDLKMGILSENSFEIIKLALNDDAANQIFKGEWMNKPLASAPLFKNIESVWKSLEPTYQNELSQIVWSLPLPGSDEIISLLKNLKSFLEKYDGQTH